MIDWSKVFEVAHREPGATAARVEAFVEELGRPLSRAEIAEVVRHQRNPWPANDPRHATWEPFDPSGWWMPDRPLPESYLSFVRWSDGGQFQNGARQFQMWGTGLRDFLITYNVPQYMPGAVPFAFNGGGIMYLFDLREPAVNGEYPILAAHAGSLRFSPATSPRVANSFPEACRGRFDVLRIMHGGIVLTAEQWLTWTEPRPMLDECEDRPRKLRLFACACARRVWHLLDAEFREAVELAEQFADGKVTDRKRSAMRETCEAAQDTPRWTLATAAATGTLSSDASSAAWNGAWAAARAEAGTHQGPAMDAVRAKQADLIRDIFGNPLLAAPTIDPNWLTADVVALAKGIYEERAFDRLPILADALQEAGCGNDDILKHCREPGEHTRGCWVVDLVLGKE